jgi:hypothetical protein
MGAAEVENASGAWKRSHEEASASMDGDERIPVPHCMFEPELVTASYLSQQRVPAPGSLAQVLAIPLQAVFVRFAFEEEQIGEPDELLIG